MELCASQAVANLPSRTNRHGLLLSGNVVNLLRYRASISLGLNMAALDLRSRTLRCTCSFPRETISEEASTGVNEFGVEKCDGAVAVEDVSPVEKSVRSLRVPRERAQAESLEDEQTQTLEFLNGVELDSENTFSILLLCGSGALIALYLAFAVVGSVESIPLLPKFLEVVGIGYTLWFATRYLLFKRNREELSTKMEEIKEQVLGSDSGR
ncbi:PREDICTED: protein CURVATURE THYLAKOID 1D, chloroplastic [Tarenaya hassleriana]|uniref:protein CURVATURE THYLAKOID 1D, chloroplastic n=1 Tax=Tarenaya hassleriana TaxID=28532 RepID=UPI00053C469C|nr:PREDICTED: protein CURVATURE THYLAKOID 1D, chloroplastic [Tarenaya hassleriana]